MNATPIRLSSAVPIGPAQVNNAQRNIRMSSGKFSGEYSE